MGAALCHDDALDGRAAIQTGFTRTPVDLEVLAVAAGFAFGIAVNGVKGCAPVCDGRAQDVPCGVQEGGDL